MLTVFLYILLFYLNTIILYLPLFLPPKVHFSDLFPSNTSILPIFNAHRLFYYIPLGYLSSSLFHYIQLFPVF